MRAMKQTLIVLAGLFLLACPKEGSEPTTTAIDQARRAAGNVATMGEQRYPLEGRIVSRDPSSNQVTVDHKEIPNFMGAMTMPYEVRGVEVSELPPDGTEITATVHGKGDTYWLTDIKAK
jgi:Cu/Ag efflux protein CusF